LVRLHDPRRQGGRRLDGNGGQGTGPLKVQ
jgi:hypothetical protein